MASVAAALLLLLQAVGRHFNSKATTFQVALPINANLVWGGNMWFNKQFTSSPHGNSLSVDNLLSNTCLQLSYLFSYLSNNLKIKSNDKWFFVSCFCYVCIHHKIYIGPNDSIYITAKTNRSSPIFFLFLDRLFIFFSLWQKITYWKARVSGLQSIFARNIFTCKTVYMIYMVLICCLLLLWSHESFANKSSFAIM